MVLVVVTLVSSAAIAADVEGDAEEAKLHFSRAEMAYKLGRYREAIRGYEAAYKALPAPAFLFNIAQAYRQQYAVDRELGNVQKALALYRTYLREAGNPPNRKVVRQLIEDLRSIVADVQAAAEQKERPGKLVLVAGPGAAGAIARLDGKVIGSLPLSQELPAGGHFLQVDRQGFRPWSGAVSIKPGSEVRLDVTLTAAQSRSDDRAQPLYRRWWFWTAVSAVVVGGATTAIVLGTRGDSGPDLPTIDLRPSN